MKLNETAVFEEEWRVLNDDFVAAEKAMTELSLQKHASDTRIEVLEKALAEEKEKGRSGETLRIKGSSLATSGEDYAQGCRMRLCNGRRSTIKSWYGERKCTI